MKNTEPPQKNNKSYYHSSKSVWKQSSEGKWHLLSFRGCVWGQGFAWASLDATESHRGKNLHSIINTDHFLEVICYFIVHSEGV